MTDHAESILERKLRPQAIVPAGDSPATPDADLTPARALRTAFSRSAAESVNLAVTVLGVGVDPLSLDDLLTRMGDDRGYLWITAAGRPLGFIAADADTRAALIEVQTMGRVSPTPAAKDRPVTQTDALFMEPLFARFLSDLAAACLGSPLEGWTNGVALGGLMDGARAAGLMLDDVPYRLVRMTLDFGVAERQGDIMLALPLSRVPPARAAPPVVKDQWSRQFRASVMEAPTQLNAVLHRYKLPLRSVEAFVVGQVLPLPGVSVGSVKLIGADGLVAGRARLGQVSGLRAVRIEAETPAVMKDGGLSTATVLAPLVAAPKSVQTRISQDQ